MKLDDNVIMIIREGAYEITEDELFPVFRETTEYNQLLKLAEKVLGKLEKGFEFVGLSYDDGQELWKAVVRETKHDITYDRDIDQSIFK